MTIVSSKEFVTNQSKYFDMAMTEQVFVQKDDNMFLFTRTNKYENPDMIFEPDEDFYRSISMEEVREKLHRVIDKLYTKNNIFYILTAFIFVSCVGKTSTTTEDAEISNIIDLSSGLKNIQTVRLSEIADSVSFIPFETTQESLQGRVQRNAIRFSERYIYYNNKYYDWTGKYFGTIGSKGQGPYEEYEGVYNLLFKDNYFYSKGTKFIEYDINGKPTGKVRNLYAAMEFGENDLLRRGVEFHTAGENFIIYNFPDKIYFVNKDFEIVSSRVVITEDSLPKNINPISSSKFITYYKDNILFYNFANDTIFYVTNTDIEPKWIVSFDDPSRLSAYVVINGTRLLTESLNAVMSGAFEGTEFAKLADNKIMVNDVYETDSYLFFILTQVMPYPEPRGKQPTTPYPFIVLYEKTTGKTMRIKDKGFVDDILGMDFFYPKLSIFDEKLINSIWPHELFSYIDECREKGKEVSPQLIELSKQVKEDDNPILILVHLKK